MNTKLKLGDSVVVKADFQDPDFKMDISGWQGRVTEIKEDNLITISWDSLTLKQIPSEMIDKCEEEGLGWTEMCLYPEDVEISSSRDKEKDVRKMVELLGSQHQWSYLGEEGKRIQAVLDNAEDDSDWAMLEAWEAYFQKTVKFPFDGEVSEYQDRGPLRADDKIKVLRVEECEDESYGILVTLRHKSNEYVFPLCDIEVIDKSSSNYQPIQDVTVHVPIIKNLHYNAS